MLPAETKLQPGDEVARKYGYNGEYWQIWVLRGIRFKPQIEAMPLSVEIHVSCTQRGEAASG
jgi:hypothetical protein